MTPEVQVYRRAMVMTGFAMVALAFFACGFALIVSPAAAAAALVGVAVAALVSLGTQAAMFFAAQRSPAVLAGWVLGEFLVKIIVVGATLWAASRIGGLPRGALAWPLVIGVLAGLGINLYAVAKGRVPYVDARPNDGAR